MLCAALLRIRTGGSRASCPLRARDGSNESSNGRSTPVLDRDLADREPYEMGGWREVPTRERPSTPKEPMRRQYEAA